MRSESPDKITNFLGTLRTTSSGSVGVLRAVPSVGGPELKRNFLRSSNDMRISKEKKKRALERRCQVSHMVTVLVQTLTIEIRGFIRVMLTRMSFPVASFTVFLAEEGGSVSKSG